MISEDTALNYGGCVCVGQCVKQTMVEHNYCTKLLIKNEL